MRKLEILCCICLLLSACASSLVKTKEGIGHNLDHGETTTASVKMENNQIKEVSIDATTRKTNQTKKQLGEAYNLRQVSKIGREWDEQVAFFETYVADKGIHNITLDKEGKAVNEDVKSGCTISIEGFIKAVKNAEKNAK